MIEGINRLWFGRSGASSSTRSTRDVWCWLPHFIVAQAVFFLGAAWFRKVQYVKTLLAILIGIVAFLGLIVLAFWLAGIIAFTAARTDPAGGPSRVAVAPNPFDWPQRCRRSLNILAFFVLPLFCWFVAWLRVSETQVSHGV